MAATALIVFDQGGPGTAGQAFEGTLAGGAVTIDNDDDTDVTLLEYTMLDVPPGSAVATGLMASGAPPQIAAFTPDVPGSYRVKLEASGGGLTDTDIRCFGVRNNRGIIIPPYQRNPAPLPLTGSGIPGAKPDEQNYGGQARGWAGDRTSGQLEQFFQTYDDLPYNMVTTTPFSAQPSDPWPCYVVNMSTIASDATFNVPSAPPPSGFRYYQRLRIHAFGDPQWVLTVNPGTNAINGYNPFLMRAPNTLDIVRVAGSAWFMIGAKSDTYERSLVAGIETVGVTGFQAIGGTVFLNPRDFPNGTATWKAAISTTNAADAAEIRLYNLTLGSAVGGSTLSTTALTPTVVSSSVTLATGDNLYEAQLRLQTTGSPNQASCRQAQVAIDWVQP
jgi:hypothetical protein